LSEVIHGVGSSYSEPVKAAEGFVEVPLLRSDRSLFAASLRQGSRAYGDGYRLIFASCSDACARRLGEALANEEGRFVKCAMLKPEE
jgi:hypothetical protein